MSVGDLMGRYSPCSSTNLSVLCRRSLGAARQQVPHCQIMPCPTAGRPHLTVIQRHGKPGQVRNGVYVVERSLPISYALIETVAFSTGRPLSPLLRGV